MQFGKRKNLRSGRARPTADQPAAPLVAAPVERVYQCNCPHCHKSFSYSAEMSGESVACPHCTVIVTPPLVEEKVHLLRSREAAAVRSAERGRRAFESRQAVIAAAVIGCVIVFVGIIVATKDIGKGKDESTSSKKREAIYAARTAIKSQLKSPSSAEFPTAVLASGLSGKTMTAAITLADTWTLTTHLERSSGRNVAPASSFMGTSSLRIT